jgi:hypothetical protein
MSALFNNKRRSIFILFGVGIFLHLLPIWIYRNFATQDGPSHLHNSAVMLDLYTGGSPIFRQYYELQTSFAGNLVSQLLLIALLTVATAAIANKLFLSLYVILFCLGFWYAVTSVNRTSPWLAFLIFPFVYSSWLHFGFFNFLLGLALCFFVIGYFVRNQESFALTQIAVLMLLFLLLFFTHAMAFGAAALIIVGLTISTLFIERTAGRNVNTQKIVRSVVTIVPAGVLLWVFLHRYMHGLYPLEGLHLAAWRIYSIAPLAAGSDIEYRFGNMLVVLLGVLSTLAAYSVFKQRRLTRIDGLFMVAFLFLVLSVAAPKAVNGGGFIRLRMVFCFFLVLILWISTKRIQTTVAKAAACASIGISVLFFISRAPTYAELDRQIDEYLSVGPFIDPNSTLLALSFASYGYQSDPQQRLVKVYLPFEHLSGLLATDKPVVDLGNYEARLAAFWTRFRREVNPFRYVDTPFAALKRPLEADLFGYPADSGGSVDYVLLWGLIEQRRERLPMRLQEQLADAYNLVYVSQGRGLAQLYRHKDHLKTTSVRTDRH